MRIEFVGGPRDGETEETADGDFAYHVDLSTETIVRGLDYFATSYIHQGRRLFFAADMASEQLFEGIARICRVERDHPIGQEAGRFYTNTTCGQPLRCLRCGYALASFAWNPIMTSLPGAYWNWICAACVVAGADGAKLLELIDGDLEKRPERCRRLKEIVETEEFDWPRSHNAELRRAIELLITQDDPAPQPSSDGLTWRQQPGLL
jgi:hypothetical protein